ncbi:MAG: hypothetical protein K0U66_10630, partial [Gammaproteobacteria bacterium]|nr:hypothetical protein [Gammaproteobacteria bacterium]
PNPARAPENTATQAPNSASGPANTATQAPNPARAPENTATQAPNSASGLANTATQAPNPASGPASIKTHAPDSDGVLASMDASALGAQERLLGFLGWAEPDEDAFARDVRIILVSADFSKEITTSVMWLNERNLDITCVRLSPHKFNDQMLIGVEQIVPLPEAADYQTKIRLQSKERLESRQSAKDYTRYLFNGAEYNKSRLVLAVIQYWVAQNQPRHFDDLVKAFPQNLHPRNLFDPLERAMETFKRQQIKRHFLAENELLRFANSEVFAVTSQWGKPLMDKFLHHAQQLGYQIEAIDKI